MYVNNSSGVRISPIYSGRPAYLTAWPLPVPPLAVVVSGSAVEVEIGVGTEELTKVQMALKRINKVST